MKKFLLVASFMLLAVVLVGCVDKTTTTPATTLPTTTQPTTVTDAPTDNDPVLHGVDDVTIEKGTVFVPLAGVTATDVEDGTIPTSSISYSGNVNYNVVGEYTATYTVEDSDGNITIVNRKVTVVFTDTQGPLISGTANKTIFVGAEFDPLQGVSANDTVDGAVPVTYTGSVNVWAVGTYDLVYSASDESDNESTAPRTITVTFGDFVFGDEVNIPAASFITAEEVMSSTPIIGGVINAEIADFTYLKVMITASSATAGTVNVALGSLRASATELAIGTTAEEHVVYFILTEALTDAVLTIDTNGLTLADLNVDYAFAEIRDMVAPVLNVPATDVAHGAGMTLAELEATLRAGVTAVDDIDGNLTSAITIDLSEFDVNAIGEQEVVYSVKDAGGNETTATRTVIVGNLVEAGYLTDPTFQNQGDGLWNEKSNDGQASIVYDAETGTMNITVTSLGNWLSAAGAYVKESSAGLEVDQWYMFTFTVKTTIARQMGFRMGLVTDSAHGWIDDFDGRNNIVFNLTTEYQTFNVFFKLDSLVSSDGSELFTIELNLGQNSNWNMPGLNGTTTFKDVAMYKVATEFDPPTYETHVGADLPHKFTEGDTAPDWSKYVTFKDMSKNVLTPIIDSSAVNMAVAGTYDVVFTATDIRDKSTVYTLTITVSTEANSDTTGPVITLKDGVPTSLDQFTNIDFDLTQLVNVIDAVDGVITVLPEMIDDGGLDLSKAGVYTVTVTAYDLSGNITVFEQLVTIVDKQAPVITAGDLVLSNGAAFDPLKLISVLDNVDGVIAKTNVTVTGLDAFMVDGFATVEGIHEITYTVEDANHNIGTKTIKVTVTGIVWDDELALPLWNPDETYNSTTAVDATEGALVISDIVPVVYEWDQPARLVYYFLAGTEIVKGQTYKFEIRVKATTATTLNFRIGSTVYAEPWIDNFEGKTQNLAITTEYETYNIVFTADKDMPNGVKFQFQYGYNASDATNTISIKTFNLVPAQQNEYALVNDLLKNTGTGFNGTVENGAVAAWNTTELAATITNLKTTGNDWELGRVKYLFGSTVLQYGKEYRFAVTIKANAAAEMRLRIGTDLGVDPWIDNFGGSEQFHPITTEYVTYYFYFFADAASYDTIKKSVLEVAFKNGGVADNMIYIKDLKIESVTRPHLFDGFIVERFDYINEEHFENVWTHRYGIYPAGNVDYASDDFLVYNSEYKAMEFKLSETVRGGWDLAKDYNKSLAALGVTNEYKYLSFYVSNFTNATVAQVWLHVGTNKNAFPMTLPAPGTSGWATIDVTVIGAASTITEFAIGFDIWSGAKEVHGSLVIYDIRSVKDVNELNYIEIQAMPNAAPVVTMDPATAAALSGMTLKAGESIESLLPTLLAALSATDAEDGSIAITAANLNLGTLDPANPVMGTYDVTVTVRDSQYRVGTLIIPIYIVTVLEDFNSFTDTADFVANSTRLYGMRTNGGAMDKATATLYVDTVNSIYNPRVPYSYNPTTYKGMNGMQVYVSKAELVAAGATWVGIYVKMTGTIVSGTAFQFYDYVTDASNYAQRTAYGNINYASSGTYVWIKVSDLRENTIMLSFQANVKSGSSGIMDFDNIVIR